MMFGCAECKRHYDKINKYLVKTASPSKVVGTVDFRLVVKEYFRFYNPPSSKTPVVA